MKIQNKIAHKVVDENYNIDIDYEENLIKYLKYFVKDKIYDIANNDIQYIFSLRNCIFSLSDNGGEFNLEILNKSSLSIPYTSYMQLKAISPERMALRIATILNEENIHELNLYEYDLSKIDFNKKLTADQVALIDKIILDRINKNMCV